MVPAVHSSAFVDEGGPVYLGEAAGYVIRFEDGLTAYFAGDTGLFGDMRLIKEMYEPAIAFLPIGDHFTMGPEAAARAANLVGARQIVPMHYGTFPLLTGTPERLKELLPAIDILKLKPGETAR
jgi:L-ascorbate metabolism protein UlaG (beta-lactamase superfamily)